MMVARGEDAVMEEEEESEASKSDEVCYSDQIDLH